MDPLVDTVRKRDQVMMLAYLPEYKESEYVDSGARRSELHDHLTFKKNCGGGNWPQIATYAEAYIAFVANDRQSITNSYYCGRFDF